MRAALSVQKKYRKYSFNDSRFAELDWAIDMMFYRNCNYFSNHNEIFSEVIIKSNDTTKHENCLSLIHQLIHSAWLPRDESEMLSIIYVEKFSKALSTLIFMRLDLLKRRSLYSKISSASLAKRAKLSPCVAMQIPRKTSNIKPDFCLQFPLFYAPEKACFNEYFICPLEHHKFFTSELYGK